MEKNPNIIKVKSLSKSITYVKRKKENISVVKLLAKKTWLAIRKPQEIGIREVFEIFKIANYSIF